jgi:hypothetical protein
MSVRPASQHRHSSNTAGSLPKSRQHSHSLSIANMNPAHRITRRKSMSSTAANNVAAMMAAAKGISGAPLEPTHNTIRRTSKPATQFRGPSVAQHHHQHPAMAASVPAHGSAFSPPSSYSHTAKTEAVTDGPALASLPESEKGNSKSRIRRASEGSRVAKPEGKRSGSELRCEKCGKGYKHSSCLTKHLSVTLSLPPSTHILSPLMPNALSIARTMAVFVQVQR